VGNHEVNVATKKQRTNGARARKGPATDDESPSPDEKARRAEADRLWTERLRALSSARRTKETREAKLIAERDGTSFEEALVMVATVHRASERAERLREGLEDLVCTMGDLWRGRQTGGAAAAFRIAERIDRWWGAVLEIRDPAKELRMRFVDAVERAREVGEVRRALLVRCSRLDVEKFSDESIARALAVATKRGRSSGPKKWPTLAAIVYPLSFPEYPANPDADLLEKWGEQLSEEHRDWSDLRRRRAKQKRARSQRASSRTE
jgi:hypothetical protein